jgi:hypothetical protein
MFTHQFFNVAKASTYDSCSIIYNFIKDADTKRFINIFFTDPELIFTALMRAPYIKLTQFRLTFFSNGTRGANSDLQTKCKFLAIFCNQLNLP